MTFYDRLATVCEFFGLPLLFIMEIKHWANPGMANHIILNRIQELCDCVPTANDLIHYYSGKEMSGMRHSRVPSAAIQMFIFHLKDQECAYQPLSIKQQVLAKQEIHKWFGTFWEKRFAHWLGQRKESGVTYEQFCDFLHEIGTVGRVNVMQMFPKHASQWRAEQTKSWDSL